MGRSIVRAVWSEDKKSGVVVFDEAGKKLNTDLNF